MKSILLVDDDRELLGELQARMSGQLPLDMEIRTWVPSKTDTDARAVFEQHIDQDTTFVVTDYDLTRQGPTGLFGTSIVTWCQKRGIPVADFSRGDPGALPKAPDLFEIRVPTDDTDAAARFVVAVAQGFSSIAEAIRGNDELLGKRSPSAALAAMLGVPEDDGQFALYGVRLGAASGALADQIIDIHDPSHDRKVRLLAYITGHLLLNAVLRFPGPIVSVRALKGYLGTDEADAADVTQLFATAAYTGPFARLDSFFWVTRVDEVLDELRRNLPENIEAETDGEIRRLALERALNRELRRHGCPRCQGRNGGFWCPLTSRTVCLRDDCSVGSNSWIPAGATVCRIEREFFEEWAPILGL